MDRGILVGKYLYCQKREKKKVKYGKNREKVVKDKRQIGKKIKLKEGKEKGNVWKGQWDKKNV